MNRGNCSMVDRSQCVVLVHGGCGIIGPMFAEREKACREALTESANAAMKTLKCGNSALTAVIEAVKVLEDCPLFNAGKGAVFAHDGTNEMDAGLMDGRTGAVGGVSTVKRIRNPVCGAEMVLKHSKHPLLCAEGAEKFCIRHGCVTEPPEYFFTQTRYDQLQEVLKRGNVPQLDHNVITKGSTGTVGAVALDINGHLAAASSTGGLSGKEPGRVSDSSIVGAGFYADSSIAVSGTGSGDEFIRISAARRIADLVKYCKLNIRDACEEVVNIDLKGVMAGFIGLDSHGNYSMPFNTPGMFRVVYVDGGAPVSMKSPNASDEGRRKATRNRIYIM